MIVFDLQCHENGHVFEGWFGSSKDFDEQCEKGLLACPLCGDLNVSKAVMAPNIGRKGNQQCESAQRDVAPGNAAQSENHAKTAAASKNNDRPGKTLANQPENKPEQTAADAPAQSPAPSEIKALLSALAKAQAKALSQSKWVGRDFADQARAMHYGETDKEQIHGEASPAEASQLVEEGVDLMPLPLPVQPPEKKN